MWTIRDATLADAEPLFSRLRPNAQPDYRDLEKNAVPHLQFIILDSAWCQVAVDADDLPVAMVGGIALGKTQKGLVWSFSTPMANSCPFRLVKALKKAICDLEVVFPG